QQLQLEPSASPGGPDQPVQEQSSRSSSSGSCPRRFPSGPMSPIHLPKVRDDPMSLMSNWSTMVTLLESRKAKSSRPLDFGVQTISINGNQKHLRESAGWTRDYTGRPMKVAQRKGAHGAWRLGRVARRGRLLGGWRARGVVADGRAHIERWVMRGHWARRTMSAGRTATREAQIKTGVVSLILVGIGKARILIPAGIGKTVKCQNARGRSVTGVILGRSGNVTGSIFLVGIEIVDIGSRHDPIRNRNGACGARGLKPRGERTYMGEGGAALVLIVPLSIYLFSFFSVCLLLRDRFSFLFWSKFSNFYSNFSFIFSCLKKKCHLVSPLFNFLLPFVEGPNFSLFYFIFDSNFFEFLESKKKKKMLFEPLVEWDQEDLEYLENLERELTPWEQDYLEEMYEQKEEYERQLKISEEEILLVGEEGEAAHIDGEAEGVEGAKVIGAILVVGDGCKTCAREQRAQHIEVVAGGSEVLAVGEEMYVTVEAGHDEETYAQCDADGEVVEVESEILAVVDEGHDETRRRNNTDEGDATFQFETEEDVPDVWMVEDESLRTRKVSKRRGMIRKWIPNPDDEKVPELRQPKEARKRAKTMHAWPKRRVRARMRGARARKERQGSTTRGSNMRGSKLVGQGIARDQARGGVRGLDARLHGPANEGCAKERRTWRLE
ncbi:Unknown protein, partial [Striga hermonthica]